MTFTQKQTTEIARAARNGEAPVVDHLTITYLEKRYTATAVDGSSESATNVAQLHKLLVDSRTITVAERRHRHDASGNWNTAKNFFPSLTVDQVRRHIVLEVAESPGYQKKATGGIDWMDVEISEDGDQMCVRGRASCRNWVNPKCSGEQCFCLCAFIGDANHIYIHRATASKGWMAVEASQIRRRLRKLGIGSANVIQQGDFLLKPANGNALHADDFQHETMGSGHHKFEVPVLFARSQWGRQVLIQEPTLLQHHGAGVKHPDVLVAPGIYILGTTAMSLDVEGWRD